MNTTTDCDAPDAFYRAEEGGKMVPRRRNGRQRVKLFNASILGRRRRGIIVVVYNNEFEWAGYEIERTIVPHET
jgi:hypothetical protein